MTLIILSLNNSEMFEKSLLRIFVLAFKLTFFYEIDVFYINFQLNINK